MAMVIPIKQLLKRNSQRTLIRSKEDKKYFDCQSVIFPCTTRIATPEERILYGIKGGKASIKEPENQAK